MSKPSTDAFVLVAGVHLGRSEPGRITAGCAPRHASTDGESVPRNQHDLSGWRKSRVPERPVGKRVTVRPDWVCEILSTNRKHHLHAKRRELHTSGVPHYWIVDLEATLLTVLRHSADGYLIASTHEPGDRARIERFDAIELDVVRLFGDLPDAP